MDRPVAGNREGAQRDLRDSTLAVAASRWACLAPIALSRAGSWSPGAAASGGAWPRYLW